MCFNPEDPLHQIPSFTTVGVEMKRLVQILLTCALLFSNCAQERSGTETGNPVTAPGDSGEPMKSQPAFTVTDSLEVNIYDSLTVSIEGENIEEFLFLWAPDGLHFSDTVESATFRMSFSDSGRFAVPVKAACADSLESQPDTVIVNVRLDPPVIVKKQDTAVCFQEVKEVTVYVEASDTNETGSIEKYYWDRDADGWDDSTETPFCTVKSEEGGVETLRWAARDDDGLFAEDTFDIIFEKPAGQSLATVHMTGAAVQDDSSSKLARAAAAFVKP